MWNSHNKWGIDWNSVILTAKVDVLTKSFSYAFCAFSNDSFLSGCSSPLVFEKQILINENTEYKLLQVLV